MSMSAFPYGIIAAAGAGPVVTVSGEVITDDSPNGTTAIAAVRVGTDGTIDQLVRTTYSQIDTLTDWIRPDGAGVGTGYYWKYTLLGSASYNPGALTANTWYEITSNRTIGAVAATTDSEKIHNITIYIADAASDSNILDSGLYQCQATQGLPP